MKDALGNRMKRYEAVTRHVIQPRTPAIIRVDGKAFHTLTKRCERPYDRQFMTVMQMTASALVKQIQNARFAYVQSDEISVLLVDYNKYESQQWFGGSMNKIISISASIATAEFSRLWGGIGLFDSRVFSLPENEVCNYFICRQEDATRNSINMAAQSVFSQKQLQGVSNQKAQEMLLQEGINWNDYPTDCKRGATINHNGFLHKDIPIFKQDRQYIEQYLSVEER